MTNKQQILEDTSVDNYLGMDDIKNSATLLIDEMFVKMSKAMNKNYDLFKKGPKLFMAKFIKKYMDDNEGLIEQAVILGIEVGDAINEVLNETT